MLGGCKKNKNKSNLVSFLICSHIVLHPNLHQLKLDEASVRYRHIRHEHLKLLKSSSTFYFFYLFRIRLNIFMFLTSDNKLIFRSSVTST